MQGPKARRSWTNKEVEQLIKVYGKMPNREIAEMMNRTTNSIRRKAIRLGITDKAPVSKKWTEEETKTLIRLWDTMEVEGIAEKLGRSVNSVNHKASRLGISSPRAPWTEDEIDYLSNSWGKFKLETLCKNLGRSKYSVLDMAVRVLKLGPSTQNQGHLTGRCFAKNLGVSGWRVYEWIQKHGLKGRKMVTRAKRQVYQINVNDFWEWAEHNQHRFDSGMFEKNTFGPEPDWMKEKRRNDYWRNERCGN